MASRDLRACKGYSCGPEVLIAIILMLQWSKQLPTSSKFDMLDLFAGAANGSNFWLLSFPKLLRLV